MSKSNQLPPFRADHVGSLLRPERIHIARRDFQNGEITADELYNIETEEISKVVDKQIEIGLKAVTDGEFRRRFWHTDFLELLDGVEGYVPDRGYQFVGIETEKYNVRNVGKIKFNPDHPHVRDFKVFDSLVDGRAVAKQTIPSPNQLFNAGIRDKSIYPDIEEYAKDVIKTYQDAVLAFYDAGCRYLQFDDVYIAGLSADEIPFNDTDYSHEELIDLALRVLNGVLSVKPKDLVITTHLCRGNYRSKYAFEASYERISHQLFANLKYDGFFLEYDDDRSGDFKPLEKIPNGGPRVVLGLFTSKFPELEDEALIKARIDEATQYVDRSQLCISPQCGFASTHHGNELTEEAQWNKLRYIIELGEKYLS